MGVLARTARAGLLAVCLAGGSGPACAQGATGQGTAGAVTTQVLTDVVSLEADRTGLDDAVLARTLDAFAAAEGYDAPPAARRSPLWGLSRAYLGPHNSLISLGTSSEHVFLAVSHLPDDHTDYGGLARRLADRFKPLGFRPGPD